MRISMAMMLLATLAACGGRVTGEVGKACMAAERTAANPALCSCVQASANQHLNGNDQKLAAAFFADPEKANDMKLSKSRSADAFWDRYKLFSATAQRSCRR